jgi:erythromycin esterase-like protein
VTYGRFASPPACNPTRMRTLALDEGLATVLERAARARIVLLGEATHGTHEFYALRAELTRRLVGEHGFAAVAAEADWPDAYRVNCFVRGADDDASPEQALRDFRRFPAWMWRNTVVVDLVEALRTLNESGREAGFYGLDLYSLHASMEAVVRFLERVDPEAALRARERFACFEQFRTNGDGQTYGQAAELGGAEPCEDDVVAQLLELRSRAEELAAVDGRVAADRTFAAEQNARVVVNAEAYYRSMFRGRASSWNLRDRHMADTLDALAEHVDDAVVVWAHNSHVGDARTTEMSRWGELNLGQLARERHPDETFVVGFSTYAGTVTAASGWGGEAERKRVRPGLAGSWEEQLHELVGGGGCAVALAEEPELAEPRLQRAIGVVYLPDTERTSHYLVARPGLQFDALVHVDETRALEPLERTSDWEAGELPETYPSAL